MDLGVVASVWDQVLGHVTWPSMSGRVRLGIYGR